MNHSLLEIVGLQKTFGGVKALTNFSCSLREGEILGLIGPNGAGKTTIFNLITGFIYPDEGKVTFRGINLVGLPSHAIATVGIARTFQKLRLIQRLSVLENVLLFFKNQPGQQLLNIFFRWKESARQEAINRDTALSLIESVGLGDKIKELSQNLSYGQQKLLNLACCLASDSDLLLLDEPVSGIAPPLSEKILSIIKKLPTQKRSVILIEHNLDAVMQISDRVIFLDAGVKVSEGTPKTILNDPKVIKAYLD